MCGAMFWLVTVSLSGGSKVKRNNRIEDHDSSPIIILAMFPFVRNVADLWSLVEDDHGFHVGQGELHKSGNIVRSFCASYTDGISNTLSYIHYLTVLLVQERIFFAITQPNASPQR